MMMATCKGVGALAGLVSSAEATPEGMKKLSHKSDMSKVRGGFGYAERCFDQISRQSNAKKTVSGQSNPAYRRPPVKSGRRSR
jgi:hypothetical protein